MNSQKQNYDPGTDQNQGVVGTMARGTTDRDNENDSNDTELVSTRVPRLDPNIVTNQSGAAMEDDDDDELIDEDLSDEEADDDMEEGADRSGQVIRSGGE